MSATKREGPSEEKRMARMALERLVKQWGKDWRRPFSPEVQRAMVAEAVLNIVCGWVEAERIPATKVQTIAFEAYTLAGF